MEPGGIALRPQPGGIALRPQPGGKYRTAYIHTYPGVQNMDGRLLQE